jgi:hypothetical protein
MYQIVMFQTDLYTYAHGQKLVVETALTFKFQILFCTRISQFQQHAPLTWGIFYSST